MFSCDVKSFMCDHQWNVSNLRTCLKECTCHFHQHFSEAFTHADPKSAKKTNSLTVFFMRLGSACVKAWSKKVDEIDSTTHDSSNEFRPSLNFCKQEGANPIKIYISINKRILFCFNYLVRVLRKFRSWWRQMGDEQAKVLGSNPAPKVN